MSDEIEDVQSVPPGASGITQAISAYNWYQSAYNAVCQEYSAFIVQLKQMTSADPMKACQLFYEFCFMGPAMLASAGEDQAGQFAAAQNVATDIRNAMGNAQNAYNNIINKIPSNACIGSHGTWERSFIVTTYSTNGKVKSMHVTVAGMAAPTGFLTAVGMMHTVMNQLYDLINDDPQLQQILGTAAINQLNGDITGVRGMFSGWNQGNHITAIASDFFKWVASATSGGTSSAQQIQDITSYYNKLNTEISGTSASIQAKLQSTMQAIQQYLAMYKQDLNSMTSTIAYFVQQSGASRAS